LYGISVDKCSSGERDIGTGEHHGVVLSSSKDVGYGVETTNASVRVRIRLRDKRTGADARGRSWKDPCECAQSERIKKLRKNYKK
jgi:hypothetical protein